ncbi:hypothetical protein G5B30_12040 [Sphingobacterium sp. SGG-5]|uniref:hypothetical protein n=1 Tax=Sphingobacterium sp. SGG-5 TaxID=2710881 RepID=UPI0013ECD00B|nr:hypothetical protein [Sphingobacterium sp. SGG-5]NGM62646.1 hypothetical protein [Sphingobacterium sp. SGG-5]
MKPKVNIIFLLLALAMGSLFFSCKKAVPEKEDKVVETPTEEEVKTKFALYDAMAYPGKPDLMAEGLLPVYLMYETALTKTDPSDANRVVLDMDKINIQAELAAEFPHVMVSTDIEDWFGASSIDEQEMYDRFNTMFDVFRAKNTIVKIGNYAIATSALCVYRYYNKDKWDDATIIENWKEYNVKRWKTVGVSDVIMPVAYIAEPDIESWIRDLDITVKEIRKHNADKKIVVYIWPQYYDKPDSPYKREVISPEIWGQLLEAVYERCDGAIIWSGKTDGEENTLHWNDARIQAIWNETKNFITAHQADLSQPKAEPERIIMDNPNKAFKIFSSINYPGTPNLISYGLHPIRLVKEADISAGISGGIQVPDLGKVEALAQEMKRSPHIPVCITGGTWIGDRSRDPAAMISRYETVKNTFRSKNTESELGFAFVAPTSLSGLRVTNGNFYVNTAGWMQSAVIPTRPLREYADYLVPASYIVDDEIALWKKEFYLTIKEAKRNNPNKPVYAYFYTDYFNQAVNFVDYYKPIKESTWEIMLEAAFKMCDGVVMSSIGNTAWSENHGFWLATKRFVEKYKGNIVFPEVVEIPTDPEEWHVPGNVIQNGSFEEAVEPVALTESVYEVVYPALLNCQGFFDATSRTTSPTAPATPIDQYVWFERGTTQSQCRIYVDNAKAHSGTNSIVLHNIGGSTSNATANNWFYHNLAQRISLDDTKKYKLTFYAQRDFQYRGIDNTANSLQVGIISSTGAAPQTNSTYSVEVPLVQNEDWSEFSIVLDLPAIIASNPGKSFETSAVFIALQTGWDAANGKTLQSIVHLDDISLVAVE